MELLGKNERNTSALVLGCLSSDFAGCMLFLAVQSVHKSSADIEWHILRVE